MTQTINLNSGNLKDIERRLYALEHASPLNNAAIGRSGLLVYDGGVITIENGGLDVTGTATVSGTLNVTGDTRLTGTTDIWGPLIVTGDTDLDGVTTITGDTTVTGNFNVDGPMKTTGTLSVEGLTTLKADLEVTTGRIIAGSITIAPDVLDGVISFDNGARILAAADSLTLLKGTTSIDADGTRVRIDGTAGRHLDVDGVGASVVGEFSVSTMPEAASGTAPNVYWDPVGHKLMVII
ncbi:hypothetical protein [Arthrobacter sp. R-11]|uniref:hypothetical protein n=1 Tax=Arthrobacter sp. R-11 TaxID=3404053 RepID=UPI003CEB8B57